MKLNLSEIFLSIQGEGPHMGLPAVFIRLSGCNLRCQWNGNLCDTPYTSWEPETNLIEVEQVISEVEKIGNGCLLAVITGGEPTIQEAGLARLCQELKKRRFRIDLETNGSGPIPSEIDTVVCSPKLSDSSPSDSAWKAKHDSERLLFKQHIKSEDSRVYLKFVVGQNTVVQEILEIVELLKCPRERVYLMPEGIEPGELAARSAAVAELALRHGFGFSPRLHIMLWGNRRGR